MPPPDVAAPLEAELRRIMAIYDRLFPDNALHLILQEGSSPIWGEPQVSEGPLTIRPHHLGPHYLGRIIRPGPRPDARPVTVVLSVPRAPTPGEVARSEAPWRAPAPLKSVQSLSPLVYEQIRYAAEMLRRRRAGRVHSQKALPFGTGTALLPHEARPAGDKRPAILIGFHWLEVGGAEKLAFDTVGWALEAGLRVFVVASVPSLQRLADRLPDHPDVTFIRLDRYLPQALWPRFVARLAADENIRLVHIHHCQPLYESLPQLRVEAPWVKVIDSTHIVEYANGGYPRVAAVWTNFIDIHHVISRQLADWFRDRCHAPGKIRLGRMLDRPAEGPADAASLPPANLVPGCKTLRLAFVGRQLYQKRPLLVVLILRALDRWARRNGVAMSAVMVGDGPFEPAVRQLLKRYGLEQMVSVRAGDADVPALLRQTDILLLPSNNEGLALVCYEAIEQGCIPISTDVGAQAEIVPDALRVRLSPRAALRDTVRAVDRLWRDAAFMDRQRQAMTQAWTQLAADPTARQVLMPIYQAAAKADGAADEAGA